VSQGLQTLHWGNPLFTKDQLTLPLWTQWISALFFVACAHATERPASNAPSPALPLPDPPNDFDPVRYGVREGLARSRDAAALDARHRPVCSLRAVHWSASLRLAPEAEVFSEVFDTRGGVQLPEGDANQGAFAEVEAAGLVLEGHIAAGDLALGLRSSSLLGGYVWTHGTTGLSWKRATEAGVELELDPGRRVRSVRGLPRVVRRCEELTLDTASAGAFEIETVLPGRQAVWETEWVGDERVPLSLTSGGSPVAYLDTRAEIPDDPPERAIVIEKRRTTRRVLYAIENAVVMGWVPAGALRSVGESVDKALALLLFLGDPNAPTSPFGADDPTRLPDLGETEPSPPRCAWNAPLTVEVSGVRRRVGVIASGIPLVLGAERDGLRQVTFEHPSVTVHPTAKFWVSERLLYPCAGHCSSRRVD
jgi:hypothetical protein